MNENLAKAFDRMAREYKKDRYRKRAYENAAAAIRNYEKTIYSGKQARTEIKGIGESIGLKIDEILESGTLRQLEEIGQEAKEKDKVLKLFEGIYGVGIKIAEEWYNEGYRSLEDLNKKYNEMSSSQQLGYKYYYDLQKKIPRNELDNVKNTLHKYWDKYDVTFVIGGSYRRGEIESNDIDIIVRDGIGMHTLLSELEKNGNLVGNLTKPAGTKWLGLVKFDKLVRRMDILLVEKNEYPYALIYFTGNKKLNVELRTYANKLGYKLSGNELLDAKGKNIYLQDEKAIFDFFNLKYLEPEQRNGNFRLELKNKTVDREEKVEQAFGWIRPDENLFIYIDKNLKNTGNIAGFDLDGTLIRPKVGEIAKGQDDLILMPKRREFLLDFIKQGYTIVIFTNQKTRSEKDKLVKFNRINNAIKLLNVPVLLFMSTADDEYRKPNTKMWESMLQMIFPIKISFYVGNSAGRPEDHSAVDILFAKRIGIPFYVPEQIFERF